MKPDLLARSRGWWSMKTNIRCEIKLNDLLSLPLPISELHKKRDTYRVVPIHFIFKLLSEPLKDHLRTVKIKGCFGAG